MRQHDILAEFQRVLTEAELPVSQTAAKRPRPRIRLAAITPANLELRGDVIEVWFDELVSRDRLVAAGEILADGLAIVDAREVWHGFPSAASQVRGGEYEVEARVPETVTEPTTCGRPSSELLAAKELPGTPAARRERAAVRCRRAGPPPVRRGPRGRGASTRRRAPRGSACSSASTPAARAARGTWWTPSTWGWR